MKFYITGCSRGLGKHLYNEFSCIGFDRASGYDIEHDIDNIVNKIEPGSVVILNAHANGTQLEYIKRLYNKSRIVVCGSIAATHFDQQQREYSEQKHNLEKEFTQLAMHSPLPMLYLKLTSSSYNDYELISNTIRFWIDNPNFTFAGYNIND